MKIFKWFAAILVVPGVLFLAGCESSQLENMDILTTYFADINKDKIKLGGGVANVRTLSDSMADNPVSLIFAEGESISEAEDRLIKSADHPLFFGGIRAVIVSEEFAKSSIKEFMESIKTDYKLRSESMFFVTKSEAEKIVKHKAINDFTGGFAAESMLKALGNEGRIVYSNLSDVFEMMSVGKVGLAVAEIKIENNIMRFDGYGIFDGERAIDYLNGDKADGVNIFLNKNASYDFYINEKKYSVRKAKERKNMIFKNGNPFFNIEFEFEFKGDGDEEIEKEIGEKLKNKAQAAFEHVRESGCDFLKLYQIYQKDYRYEFEKSDYRSEMKNAAADIKVKLKKGE